ncbi:hypothetical protein [Paraburkholderia monticola]|uniref:hypothetical protein n=1 Tax=Paraburkholderia monticola TaxID=1399968 RepID=UPI0013A57E2A|nr:hypothetical protein [Paraburkholderia monticola]
MIRITSVASSHAKFFPIRRPMLLDPAIEKLHVLFYVVQRAALIVPGALLRVVALRRFIMAHALPTDRRIDASAPASKNHGR